MLTDKHMHAAHKLLQKQFPDIQGCQSTLLEQNNRFKPVSANPLHRIYALGVFIKHWRQGRALRQQSCCCVNLIIGETTSSHLPWQRWTAPSFKSWCSTARWDSWLWFVKYCLCISFTKWRCHRKVVAWTIQAETTSDPLLWPEETHCLPICQEEGEEMLNEAVHHSAALHFCFARVVWWADGRMRRLWEVVPLQVCWTLTKRTLKYGHVLLVEINLYSIYVLDL